MKKIFCPESGKLEWANLVTKAKPPAWRCTKCGKIH